MSISQSQIPRFMKTFLHPLAQSVCGANRRSRRFLTGFRAFLGTLAVLASLYATTARAQVFVQEVAPSDLVANQFFGESISANATQFAVGTVLADKPAAGTVPAMVDAGAVYLYH